MAPTDLRHVPPGAPGSFQRSLRRWLSFLFACFPILSATAVFLVYVATLAPTVTGEDAGELITAAWFFGVPHPPGYPLWTLVGGAWLHILPFGNIAWRANLFSAACSAAAVGFLCAALRRMRFSAPAATSSAMAVGFGLVVWSQSVIAEVYALHLAITAVLLWLAVRWRAERCDNLLAWGALLIGLGMSNHHILGFAALGIGAWALGQSPGLICNARLAVVCVLLFAAGLLPYGYLLWAGGRDVPVRWGETSRWEALWEHVSRGQYKSEHPIEAPVPLTTAVLLGRWYYGLRWLAAEFTPVLAPLLVTGMMALVRRRSMRAWLWLTLCTGLSCGPLLLYMTGPRPDRQDEFVNKVFLTPLAIVAAIPLAAGLTALSGELARLRVRWGRSTLRVAQGAAVLAIVGIPLAGNFRHNNLRRYWWAEDHARNMLACMQPDATIIPTGDHNSFPLIYLRFVAGVRPDITIADKYGYIELDLYRDMRDSPGKPRTPQERDQIEAWLAQHVAGPLYYTVKRPCPLTDAELVPVGLLYVVNRHGMEVDTESCWSAIRYRNLGRDEAPIDLAAANILSDLHYAQAVRALARGDPAAALREFDACVRVGWGLKEILNNVGSALCEAGLVEDGVRRYEAAARMDWRYTPARWNLARIFKSDGRTDWARKVFEDLARAAPGDFRPAGELGFLWAEQLHDLGQAREWWYESLKINPRQPQIIAALAALDAPRLEDDQSIPTAASAPSHAPPAGVGDGNGERTAGHSRAASSPVPVGSGRLRLAEAEVDFGPVVEGVPVERELPFRNDGDQELRVLGIECGCSCVTAVTDAASYAPGSAGTLTVRLQTGGRLGPLRETLTLSTNDSVQLHLKIPLRADVMSDLAAEPSSVHIEAWPHQSPPPVELAIESRAARPFVIKSAAATRFGATFDWDRGQSASRHMLTMRPEGKLPPAGQYEVAVSTSNSADPLRIPVQVDDPQPARARPELLFLGRIERHQTVERRVRIESRRPEAGLELRLRPAPTTPGVDLSLAPLDSGGTTWELHIRIDGVSASAGRLPKKVLIDVSGFASPLEIPLHGSVAD